MRPPCQSSELPTVRLPDPVSSPPVRARILAVEAAAMENIPRMRFKCPTLWVTRLTVTLAVTLTRRVPARSMTASSWAPGRRSPSQLAGSCQMPVWAPLSQRMVAGAKRSSNPSRHGRQRRRTACARPVVWGRLRRRPSQLPTWTQFMSTTFHERASVMSWPPPQRGRAWKSDANRSNPFSKYCGSQAREGLIDSPVMVANISARCTQISGRTRSPAAGT